MGEIHIDLETRSRTDLLTDGVYNYATCPSTEIICMSWAFGDGPIQTWEPLLKCEWFPVKLMHYIEQGVPLVAHNAAFERLMFEYIICPDFGVPVPGLEQWHCTAYTARCNNLPGSLFNAARCLGVPHQKDRAGRNLINMLSIPQPDGTFNEDATLLGEMSEYCSQDVRAERDIAGRMREPTEAEWQDFFASERINDNGVLVDVELARAAQAYAKEEEAEIIAMVTELSGGKITKFRGPRLLEWVTERIEEHQLERLVVYRGGKKKYSLDKHSRHRLLECDDLDPIVREVVEGADTAYKSSVGKYKALEHRADPETGRMHGAFVANGASQSGRFCVDGDTLVDTVNSPVRIKDLNVGDLVLTHNGTFAPVVRKIYKGVEAMYRISAGDAEVTCTAGHRLLTERGWQHVSELQDPERPGRLRADCRIFHVRQVPQRAADSSSDGRHTPHGHGGVETGPAAGRIRGAKTGKLLPFEKRPEEPYVWPALRPDKYAGRLQSAVGWGQVFVGAPADNDGGPRLDELARTLAGTPHKQRPDRQQVRQSVPGYGARTRCVTFAETGTVEAVGERGVWDIEVGEHHSYVAGGLIHHNSAWGAQVHNFPRNVQERWPELRQDLVDNIMPEDITDYFQAPMMVLLSGMLRPTMMAAEGKVFLTSDWSAIEGRVNPWLTNTPAGDSKLSLYRQGIDTYKVAAMAIDKVGYEDVTDEQRQIGKVSELALGFGGGAGAFLAMARGYGVTISRNRAEQIKHAWRDDNPWAVQMWRDVEKAAMAAIRRPGEMYQVGRVTYFAVEDILVGGKTLFCELPCGRLLTYPDVRIEDKRAPWGEMVPSITALRANWTPKATEREWPRAALWGGLLVENITQGTAASLLRLKLREALSRGLKVVLHVHDEIVVESDKVQADQDREILFNIMNTAPEWAEGLPLKAPVTVSRRFSK